MVSSSVLTSAITVEHSLTGCAEHSDDEEDEDEVSDDE